MKEKDTIQEDHFEEMVKNQIETQEQEMHEASQGNNGSWMNTTVWWVVGILAILAVFMIIWLCD